MYFPYSQSGQSAYGVPTSMTLVVRTSGNPAALTSTLRGSCAMPIARIPISAVATMDTSSAIRSRAGASRQCCLAGFALLALTLAGIGIYGVISYGVSQRRYEIGVRIALGASPGSIIRLVVAEGGRMTVVGLGLGLAGALVVERLIQTMLVGVSRGRCADVDRGRRRSGSSRRGAPVSFRRAARRR